MARKVNIENCVPDKLWAATDQEIEADLADLKAGVEALEDAREARDYDYHMKDSEWTNRQYW